MVPQFGRRALVTSSVVVALTGLAACAVPPPASPTAGKALSGSSAATGKGHSGGTASTEGTATGAAGATNPEIFSGPGSFGALVNWTPPFTPPSPTFNDGFVSIHLAVSPQGDVLMWDRVQGLTGARRWDPNTQTFDSKVPITGTNLGLSLFCAFQTRLPDGRLAVVGGTAYKQGNTGLPVMEFYDFTNNTWTAGPNMKTARWYPTMIELPDGRLMVFGGQAKAGSMANIPELYNPATNTWTELTGLAESKAPGLYPRAIMAPNGKVFVIKTAAGQSAYMDVDTQKYTNVAKAPPKNAGAGMAMYDTGKILLYNIGSTGTDSWVIDLNAATPAWRKVGSLHFKRKKFSTVLLPDGRVMAIGGSIDGTSVASKAVLTPEIWDPVTEQWSDLPTLAVPRMYHSNALLLPNGSVITAGGGRAGSAPNYPSEQIYTPSYLTAPNRPVINSLSTTSWAAGGNVSLNVSSANGVSSVVLMGLPGVTHGLDTQQKRITLQVTSAYNPATGDIGVKVPAVTTTAPGHYYAIALDSRGVPTAAKIVQVVGSAPIPPAAAPAASESLVPRVVPDSEPQEED
jgi:hypothetical protein